MKNTKFIHDAGTRVYSYLWGHMAYGVTDPVSDFRHCSTPAQVLCRFLKTKMHFFVENIYLSCLT